VTLRWLARGACAPFQTSAMGHNQTQVKEMYLRVIEATIAGSKAEFEETDSASDALNATLDKLRERWRTRLLEGQDFTDDPSATFRSAAARGGGAAARKVAAAATAAAAATTATARAGASSPGTAAHGAAPVRALPEHVGAHEEMLVPARIPQHLAAAPGHLVMPSHLATPGHPALPGQMVLPGQYAGPPAGHHLPGMSIHAASIPGLVLSMPKLEAPLSAAAPPDPGLRPAATAPRGGAPGAGGSGISPGDIPQGDGPGSSGGDSPPAKRARHEGEVAVNDNEDLDSADSDDELGSAGGSDQDAENYVLAQHDSVKKGGGNGKWKVRLKDGILHLNGRDYLFSKAACDLDW
jgi:Transcription factor IIA, alpha/beta subunit